MLFKHPVLTDWLFGFHLFVVVAFYFLSATNDLGASQISPGQAAFDLIATTIDRDSMFDIDICDAEQRQYI